MALFQNARERATRRKSGWNLLLLPGVVLPLAGLWLALVLALQLLHSALYPDQHLINSDGIGTILTTVGSFVAALVPAMVIGNMVVRLIGPARRALDREASFSVGAGYSQSQNALLHFGRVPVLLGLLLGITGAVMSW